MSVAATAPSPDPHPGDDIADEIRKRAFSALQRDTEKRYDTSLTDLLAKIPPPDITDDIGQQIVFSRKCLLLYLMVFMTLETAALFAIIVVASSSTGAFKVDPRTLQILVGATIAQVSAMLIVIVRSVYSDSLNQLILRDKKQPARRRQPSPSAVPTGRETT